jgi:hypothetical protein
MVQTENPNRERKWEVPTKPTGRDTAVVDSSKMTLAQLTAAVLGGQVMVETQQPGSTR